MAFIDGTWPWWSAPQTSITRSKLRIEELVIMIGDVGGGVGRPAVGADQHAVALVAQVLRAQPRRAFALVDQFARAQQVQHRVEVALANDARLGEPVVEADARAVEVGLDPVHDAPRGQRADLLGALLGQVGEAIAVLLTDRLRPARRRTRPGSRSAASATSRPSACW